MNRTLSILSIALLLSGCGYKSRDNVLTGQAKKAVHATPLICPDYAEVDISLGVLRNGVGSMSTQDIWMNVPDRRDFDLLQKAAAEGSIVKISYDQMRLVFCSNTFSVTHAELEK